MFDLQRLVRENIRRLKPYTSARDEFTGAADVYLDANENAFGSPSDVPLNRYPDPLQRELKEKIALQKNVKSGQIFVGNGSDEAIDLLFRIFCEPGRDAAIICPPTYGMYEVAANINGIQIATVPLSSEFQLDAAAILKASSSAKLIFICSPNNPSGNSMDRADILKIAQRFGGIVVVDEAYADFSEESSILAEIGNIPNIVVLQTFSKAWGLAGARVGLAFASEEIIELFTRVKPPYNVNALSQRAAVRALDQKTIVADWVACIKEQRALLARSLEELEIVERIYPSDSNFLLVRFAGADAIYEFLLKKGIVVRNRSRLEGCEGCLRITVGTADENLRLLSALNEYRSTAGTTLSNAGKNI